MFIVFLFCLGVLGTIVGSFINVLVVRGHDGETLLGRSHCTHCHAVIPAKYLIPVLGYFLSKRKCFSCGKAISPRYVIGEVILGLLLVLAGISFGGIEISLYFLATILLVITLYYMSYYDFLYQEIPALSLVVLAVVITLLHVTQVVYFWSIATILTGLIPGGVFLLLWIISRGRLIGFGDILLMLLIGYHVGFIDALSIITVSFWIGALFIILLALYKKYITRTPLSQMRHMAIPFGPFLCASWLILVLGHVSIFSTLLPGLF
jgi:prepilin signal peptidase PulO-like enzyme (type II secretory pathway)